MPSLFRAQVSPAFQKFPLGHLLLQKTYIHSCFNVPKETQRGFFNFMEIQKVKIAFGICFAVAVIETVPTSGEHDTASLLPRELLSTGCHYGTPVLVLLYVRAILGILFYLV